MRGGTVIALGSQNGMGIGNGDGGSTGTFAISSGSPIIFTPSIAPGSSPWPPGIAIVDIIDITPGTFPVLFNSITVRLQENFTVPSGAALTIPFNMTLDLYGHTLTNQGTVNNQGRVELNGGQVDPASTGTWNENPPQ
jgi:hypothetical protein